MEEEYVETSDPEEIGYHYVWRKSGNGQRVLDTVRAPFGTVSKRVRLSPVSPTQDSCSVDTYVNSEDNEVPMDSDASQDPLLIQTASTPPETELMEYTDPLTPTTSILSVRRFQLSSPSGSHSPPNSQDPLRMSPQRSKDPFEPEAPVLAIPASPSSPRQPAEDGDGLMLFSPASPLSSPPPSPNSPRNIRQRQTLERSPSPIQALDLNAPSPEPQGRSPRKESGLVDGISHIDPSRDPPRYTLRQRTKRQEKPYLFDLAEYKTILRHVPEAIVNHRSPRRGGHQRGLQDQYEEEESQDLAYQASDDGENDGLLSRRRRAGSPRSPHATDSLPRLPESDEEDRRQVAALRKEWRVMERQRKSEANAAQEETRRKKKNTVHSFPLNNSSNERTSAAPEPPVRQRRDTSSPSNHRTRRFSPSEVDALANSPAHSLHPPSPRDPSSSFSASPPALPYLPLPNQSHHSSSPTSLSAPTFVENTYDSPIVIDSERETNSPTPMVLPIAESESDLDEAPFRSSPRRNSLRRTQPLTPDSDASDFESAAAKKARRRMKTLNRMYPTFMLSALDKEVEKKRRRQRQCDTSAPLDAKMALGHARKTLRKGKALANVKGDSETSDEDLKRGRSTPRPSRSPSGVNTSLARRSYSPNLFNTPSTSSRDHSSRIRPVNDHQVVTHKHTDVIDISDDSSESECSSSSSEIDDTEITSYVHGVNPSKAGLSYPRQENLIDYMLAKNCRIGRKQRSGERKVKGKGKGRRSGRNEYDYSGKDGGPDGLSRGQNYKQKQITFKNHRTSRSESTSVSSRLASLDNRQRFTARSYSPELSERYCSSSRSPSRNDQPRRATQHPVNITETDKHKKTKKQRDKERRNRAKTNNIYVFPGNGTSITTGRRRGFVNFAGGERGEVYDLQQASDRRRRRRHRKDGRDEKNIREKDLIDEDFRSAIASAPKISKPKPQFTCVPKAVYQQANAAEELRAQVRNTPLEMKAEQSPEVSDNKPLICGITFGPSTYIGKGILSQLLDGSDNTMTISYSAHGFTVNSLTSSIDLQTMLPGICNGVLESLNDLPDDDDDARYREWESLLRGVCRAISLRMSKGEARETGEEALKASIRDQSTKIVSRLQDASVDLPVLNLCWFAVEILLRAAFSPTSPPLYSAMKLLVTHAFRFGISKALSHVRNNKHLTDSSSMSQRIAELWVCLFHVTPGNAFWKLVEDVFQDRMGDGDGLDTSEAIWSSLSGLCALAQFTVHGVTTSNSRLPPAWNIVSLALKQVRLGADHNIDDHLSSKTLQTRDRYIRLLMARCFLLNSLWKWKLDSPASSTVLNQLLEIFRSRNFANLVGEKKPDFPAFFSTHNWRLCSQYNENDTAFELYLKLIVQAAGGAETDGLGGRIVSPRIRKLLSLVTPQSALTFGIDGSSSPDVSMLYNRVAAVSLTIYLDPSTHASRLSHARKYINFQEADANTRTVFIQCLMRLSMLMVISRIPMTETFAWFGDIGNVLAREVKNKGSAFNKAVIHINLLLRSLRYIIVSYGEIREYPDPGFFVPLAHLFHALCGTENDMTTLELMRLIQSFLSERAKIVPAPIRPSLPETETEESQETQYDDEQWDMNDPHLLAALDNDSMAPSVNYASKDSEVVTGRKLDGIRWLFFRAFKDYIQKTKLDETLLVRAEDFLDAWLGCVDLILRHDTKNKTWLHALEMGRKIWSSLPDVRRKRRIKIRFMFNMLRLEPKSYLEFPDRSLECLLPALLPVTVPSELTIENEFLSLLLSIDGPRHPLLRSLPFGRPSSAVDYNISVSELQSARWGALRNIFTTVNESLQRGENGPEAEGQKYLGWCIDFLSLLRDLGQVSCSEIMSEEAPAVLFISHDHDH
ncbi:hypothetical protein E1B28_007461 [Marasmius oreades]|uniref:Uncharacterized protein n=1 Tax=Marasmius oreades TaxID=181124 RepID=A0A9P7S1P7_9AGAR|nr:uncharacterized protein E1B28_007461 [Marasmius oreades]KAG7093821.1 hypothetical protein E1B28_007461 [Marasmius oreades]